MSLYGSFCLYGLDISEALRDEQTDSLRILGKNITKGNESAKDALNHVIDGSPPSTNVGVTRLLGGNGVIARIDACREMLPWEFYDQWDSDYEAIIKNNSIGFSELEKTCLSIWAILEQEIEFTADYWAPKAHWAIRRWSSNFFLHLGALMEDRTAFKSELDEFSGLLDVVANQEPTIETKDKIHNLEKQLERLLNSISNRNSSSTVNLSHSVTLTGDWVKTNLKPKIDTTKRSGGLFLSIGFNKNEFASLNALIYLWLKRCEEGRLDRRCFPSELLTGVNRCPS